MDLPFQLVGGTNLDTSLGMNALMIYVDNYSAQFLHIPAVQRFIPPNTVGVAVKASGGNRAQAIWEAPPGVAQPALSAGQIALVTFSDQPGSISAGVSTVAPLQANWLIGGTTNIAVVRPDLAAAVALVTAGAFAFGAWVEIAPAADLGGHALTYIAAGQTIVQDYYIEVGVGAIGFEVSIGRFLFPKFTGATPADSALILPMQPPVVISANSRVAARVAAGGGGTLNVHMGFMPRPF